MTHPVAKPPTGRVDLAAPASREGVEAGSGKAGAGAIIAASPEAKPIPEHMVVLLLEGAQRFLGKAEEAIHTREPLVRDHHLKKVTAILGELHRCLNHEAGGPLVDSLIQVYAWWGQEIAEAGAAGDPQRLRVIASQMGEIRKTWEHVLFKGEGMSELPER